MDLLTKYPHALEQLAILKKDYLGGDTAADLSYSIQVGQQQKGAMTCVHPKYSESKTAAQKYT